jgi:hypothetical protein
VATDSATLFNAEPQFRAIEPLSVHAGHRGTKSVGYEIDGGDSYTRGIDDGIPDDDDDDETSFDHTIERAEKKGISIPFVSISPMVRVMHQDSQSLPSSLPEEVIVRHVIQWHEVHLLNISHSFL